MVDYDPLNIAEWSNVDAAWVSRTQKMPIPDWPPPAGDFPYGKQEFHGLPFLISRKNDGASFIGFGEGGFINDINIPLRRRANWIIFAHRLLETHIFEGEPVGRSIAVYEFGYETGDKIAVPVRERFEIAPVPTQWGQLPLLAVPDIADRLMPRDNGPWDQVGFRLMDVEMIWPNWFVLWAWRNPHPEIEINKITVTPSDRPFIIAAVTISALEEDPFGREPRRPVIITLNNPLSKESSSTLDIQINRGTATYPYPLPEMSRKNFLADPFKGWGQHYPHQSNRFYTEIEARPSAQLSISKDSKEQLSVRWQDVLDESVADNANGRIEIIDAGKNWVHVEVLDDLTGDPIPCRVHFRSPDGIPYQPHGHHNHLLSDKPTWNIDVGGDVRLGGVVYAYIDGKCQGWLPRGEVTVDIARGFEYQPLRIMVEILPGQQKLSLRLKRWADMAAERWFSGDTHVHYLSTMGALLEGSGEDLNVVNLLQSQWGHHFSNTEDFVGQPISLPGKNTVVYTSQENRQHILGHLILLGLQQPVMPWGSGGADEAELGGALETTLSHWADSCRDQGGTVILPHFPLPNCENPALIATSRVDAVELCWHDMYFHYEYYRYLNGGYRLPLVAGTDKMSGEVPVGINRTYVHIPEEQPFTYQKWCKYLKMGRTFVTTGPLLRFTVEGAQIGDTVNLPGNGGAVQIQAEAKSILPIHTLEIIQEGKVVAAQHEPKGVNHLSLNTKLLINRHSWLAARVGGPTYQTPLHHHDTNRRGLMAHSSPIYIAVGEPWWMKNQETAQYMLTMLHGGLEFINKRSRQHSHGSVTHHHGESDHLAYLVRPFHEAIQTIKKRQNPP